MSSRLLAAAGVSAVLAASALAADEPAVRYQLSPVMKHGKLAAVAIEMRFKGEADGETILHLPDRWGGQSELWRAVTDLKVAGTGVRIQPTTDPALRTVNHAPNVELTVSYRIIQDVPGEPKASDHNPYRPIVQPGYFHLLGDAIFIEPEWKDEVPSSFVLTGLPKGWRFASDLEHAARGGHALRLGDIVESVLVGGDFRVISRPGPGGYLRVALRGTWKFSDDQIADKIAHIVASHSAFWHDADEPFLVTILPLRNETGGSSLGGTGRGDAFAFFATDNGDEATINRLLAHEHMHTWIPRRIGRMPEKDEARDYWLSEGFTDFYADRLLVRDGFWSVEDFAASLNETLAAYHSSPVKNEPNSRIVADFWNNPSVGGLAYQRGFLLAFLWDQRLREASHGASDLDDVMLAMKARFAALQSEDALPYAVDNFAVAMRAAHVDPAAEVARFVENGELILLPADVFGPCGSVAALDLPEFTRGFDPEKTGANGNVVVGTDPDGPAYAAGMRDGMKIVKRESGKPGDSRVELVYRVNDNGAERIIRYKPEGKRHITLQELQLTANMDTATREACVRRIGGS
jgi:predicted metalloprotease with PDZ domain